MIIDFIFKSREYGNLLEYSNLVPVVNHNHYILNVWFCIISYHGDNFSVKIEKALLGTVDLMFARLNFREFLIFGLFTKFRIRKFSFFFCSAIMKTIFLNS